MPKTSVNFAHQSMGERIAHHCRTVFPRNTAKELARCFGCSVETTTKWLRGGRPSNDHFDRMVAEWGPDFLAYVYEPVIGPDPDFMLATRLQSIANLLLDVRMAVKTTTQSKFRPVRGRSIGAASMPVMQQTKLGL